jgi:hypothetical protein
MRGGTGTRSTRWALLLGLPLALAGCPRDRDADGRADVQDNCPDVANANQVDADGDGAGNACDDDSILRLLVVQVPTPDGGVQGDAEILAVADDVAAYYDEVSYGNLRIAGIENADRGADVAGPFPSPIVYDGFNDLQIIQWAEQQLVLAGVNQAAYDQTVFLVPDRFGNRTPGGFTAGWAGGDIVWLRAVALGRIGPLGHEIGHNLAPGLGHANLLSCSGPAPYDLVYTGCTSQEYLDPFDAMGWSELRGHMSGFNRERVGFFSPGNVHEVTENGQYWLAPIERPGAGVRALKIRRSPLEWIYLEYRQPIGYDAISTEFLPGSTAGVQIRTTYFAGSTAATDLIRPGGGFSLAPGQSYDAGPFTLTTVASTPDVTLVEVQFE